MVSFANAIILIVLTLTLPVVLKITMTSNLKVNRCEFNQ
jgi:hypothetical protein